MATTITALFDSRSDAEAAKERLKEARVDADHVHLHDKSSSGHHGNEYSSHQDRGLWESIKNAFAPDEDRHTYEEGVRRGATLLTADVDDDCVDDAVRVLEEANTIDIDDRSNEWRSSGWDYPAAGAVGASGGVSGFGDLRSDETDNDRRGAFGGDDREEVIPVVQEDLVVGKRDVDRGGVRVRSYMSEVPVHEQVRLRNERIDVERRPVDQALSSADGDAFRERSVEMTATGEEAVIGKNARVVEEVVISKTADERVEDVDGTVRRTQVDIDRDLDTETTHGSGFGRDGDR